MPITKKTIQTLHDINIDPIDYSKNYQTELKEGDIYETILNYAVINQTKLGPIVKILFASPENHTLSSSAFVNGSNTKPYKLLIESLRKVLDKSNPEFKDKSLSFAQLADILKSKKIKLFVKIQEPYNKYKDGEFETAPWNIKSSKEEFEVKTKTSKQENIKNEIDDLDF